MVCFTGTWKAKFQSYPCEMQKIKERVGENSFFFSSHVSLKSLYWHKSTLIFPSLHWSGFCLPFGKMWKFLVAQGCKLAWKVCLWEKEAHVSNGSVSYRYMELYLFPLVILWNVFYSGKVVYQAHPWKWAGFPSNPDFIKLHQAGVSWVPGVVFLFLGHQACPRAHSSVHPTVVLVKEKINLASRLKISKTLRRRKFATWQGIFLQ